MLTLFTIPKPFVGHSNIIQRNAIKSWTMLRPECEIILFGDEEGTEEVAQEFGVRYIPNIACNEYGTPRVDSMFELAEANAENPLLCHINADIILMDDFTRAVEQASQNSDWFMMSGQRWNVDVTEPVDFDENWQENMRNLVAREGRLGFRTGVDYWVYSRGLLTEIPPFVIGRTCYDQWLIYRARKQGAILIDSTPVVMDVHQDHDYSHHADGAQGVYHGPEHFANKALAGGRSHLFIIKDRTHVLTPDGIKPVMDFWRLWRGLRTARVLYPRMPLPLRFLLAAANGVMDLAANLSMRLNLIRSYAGPQNMPTK